MEFQNILREKSPEKSGLSLVGSEEILHFVQNDRV